MKKPLILFVCIILIAASLVGCGAQPAATEAPAAEAPAAEAPAAEAPAAEAPAAEAPAEEAPAAAPAKELTVGALWLDASEFYTGVKAGILSEAAAQGYEIKLLDNNSNGNADTEAEQMQTLIGANVDAIIIAAVSTTSSVALIKQAKEAGIPVVCYNTCISNEDAEKYVYTYVTGDQVQQGAQTGKAMGQYYVDAGITDPVIGVVSCERYGACQDRIKGFTEELLKLVPNAKIVDNQEALEVDKAAEVATNMLTAHPEITGFYGEAGNMVQGAAVAIDQAGLTDKVVVFGHDISPATAKLLLESKTVKYINAMIAEDFGKTSFDMAVAAIDGKQSPGVIYNMTPVEFTSTNPEQVQTWLDANQ